MWGVSRGLSWLAMNVDGSGGGVRMAVAAGRAVSLGDGVAVGWNCASAVSKAWVSAALISGVGAEAGWQAVRRERNKKREGRSEKRKG